MATLRANVAANLRWLLQERGMTQKSFAKAGGFDEGMVSRWLNELTFPADRQLDRIAAVFKCSYEELVQDPDKPRSTQVPLVVDSAIRELARRAGYEIIKKK